MRNECPLSVTPAVLPRITTKSATSLCSQVEALHRDGDLGVTEECQVSKPPCHASG